MTPAPQTPAEALTFALALAISAPDEERKERALSTAIGIAETMSTAEVIRCQQQAKQMAATMKV